MHQRDVEPVETEPLKTILDRPQDAVPAVVTDSIEVARGQVEVLEALGLVGRANRLQDAADLGRDDIGVTRYLGESGSKAPFAPAEAV